MLVKWPVIRWQMRHMGVLNMAIGAIAGVYVLMRREPFNYTSPWWFAPLHAAAIAWFLGRSTTPAEGYLHLQGFGRDELWWHGVLSACGCALCAWVPAAVLLLTPLRGAWQDLLQNPSYPYMAPAEHRFVWIALWEYAVSVPLGLYAAARWGHPARGNDSGVLCAAVLIVLFIGTIETARFWAPQYALTDRWPLFSCGLAAAGVALVLGRQLFREREVQP
jgi:hypothetical protein